MSVAVVGELRLAFRGGPAREGPLTLAQRNVARWLHDKGGADRMLALTVAVPAGTGLPAVVDAVRLLVERHESLRTTFTLEDPKRQRVAGAGELVVAVHEAGHAADERVHAVAAALADGHPEPAIELPLRAALVTAAGTPRWLVLALSHLAVDAASVDVLRDDLGSLLRGAPAPTGDTRQPVDQATVEADEATRVRSARAVEYWRDRLSGTPQCMFALPDEPAGAAPFRGARLRSGALARAASVLGARTGTTRSAAVLAALTAVVGHYTGNDACVVAAVAGNRHVPPLRRYVGPLAQDALVTVDLAGTDFEGLVRRVWAASLQGYRHSRFDAVDLWAAIDAVGLARGTDFARDLVFNDLSGYAPGGSEPVVATELAWLPVGDLAARFACYVNRLDATGAELVVRADTRRIPAARLELAVRGVERLLVAAAAGPVGLDEVGALTGLAPAARGPGWHRVDSCWVDLAQVRRLLRDALPASPSGVFAVPTDDGEVRFVAYLAAGPGDPALLAGGPGNPAGAHRACVAALAGRETAMAPHRYVWCAAAPDDLDDLEGWRRQRIVEEGTGRW